ncbi:MAG: Uncharacterized protein JWR34_2143 [Mycobacterium sp.]|jgi:hypothetical protein|nr:Uncharacterized protein [Mycobacterium sp.]
MYSGCRIATVEAVSNTVPGTACYLLEWYRPDPTDDQLERIATALAEGAAASSADGFPVQLIMTLAVPADDVVFAVLAAASPDDVTQTCRRAGIPAERLTATLGARIGTLKQGETPDWLLHGDLDGG